MRWKYLLIGWIICGGLLPTAVPANNLLLVGLKIRHMQVATCEVRQADSLFLIPLQPFADAAKIKIQHNADTLRLVTPIGSADLPTKDQHHIGGTLYISEHFIETKLITPVFFEQADFALNFDIPWQLEEPPPSGAPLKPDAHPPAFSLSAIHAEVVYNRYGPRRDGYQSSTILGGRFHGGIWRASYRDDFTGAKKLREYSWLRPGDQMLFLVGQQRLQLHPLLNSLELTGVQAGWINRPPHLQYSAGANELLGRRAQVGRSFYGEAPPGGRAQLKVNGRLLAQQMVGLDGLYQFADVNLPTRQFNTIEVHIFDRFNSAAPVEIREMSINTSEFMLPGGVISHLAGLGTDGNLTEEAIPNAKRSGVGFYQYRQGLSDRMTVEATLQNDRQTEAQLGLIVRPLAPLVATACLAGIEGHLAYDLEIDADMRPFQLRAMFLHKPDDLFSPRSLRAEAHYRPDKTLRLSLTAVEENNVNRHIRFVRPGISWNPTAMFSLYARPDYAGNYALNANYQLSRAARFMLNYYEHATVEGFYGFARRYQLTGRALFGQSMSPVYELTLHRGGLKLTDPLLHLGISLSEGRPAWIAGGSASLRPGLLAQVEYRSSGRRVTADSRLQIALTADWTLSGGRLLPAATSGIQQRWGAIAGRIRTPGNTRYDLDRLKISLNGQRAIQTDAQGVFYLGFLKEGVYTVEFDPAGLPLELTPLFTSRIVAVAAGATTHVDFSVLAQYGLAGRVTDESGQALPGVLVELRDLYGLRIKAATTDQFGLYRLDGLPVGDYRVVVAPESLENGAFESSERAVELRDFMFGQDVQRCPYVTNN